MKFLGRMLFMVMVVLLWGLCVLGGLEGWARWRFPKVQQTNPFIYSRTENRLWPVPRGKSDEFSDYLKDTALRDALRGPGKSKTPLDPPSPEQEMSWRIPLFLQFGEFERQVFSNVYGLHLFSMRGDGVLTGSISVPQFEAGKSLESQVGADDALRVLTAADEAYRSETSCAFVENATASRPGPFGYCVFKDPQMTAQSGGAPAFWLAYPREEAWIPPVEDTLWELPFFTYKKHSERKEHISVLGITEDFYMNNFGFRDADIVMPKPPGTYRIVCVGASTTEEGPINDLTYPAILEAMLNRHFGGKRIDVINCGISGMNSLKHRMRLADYLALEPDMIVIYNAVNDICHDLFRMWIQNATPRQQRLRESAFIRRYLNRWIMPSDAVMKADIESIKISNLRFMQQYARDHGVKVAICSFAAPNPDLLSKEERDYYEYYTWLEWGGRYSSFGGYLRALNFFNEGIKNLCEEEGLLYIPVAEKLQGGAIFFGDICHLRNPGIEKKAGIIFEALLPGLETELASRAP